MEVKSAKKSFSRLPNLSKKPRMSLQEEPNQVGIPMDNFVAPEYSTPLRILPDNAPGSSTPLTGRGS